jgi:Flp pilus assembly protein TadG
MRDPRRETVPVDAPEDDLGATSEAGAISTWVAMTTVAMLLFVGIAVDFGGQIAALQNVRDVAAQAARTGGQQVDLAQATRGEAVAVDATAAQAAARAYLAAADVDGTVTVDVIDGDRRLVVSVEDTYATKVLTIIGVSSLPVTGTAEARLARVVGGVEQ